jgi:type IV pilus assembly protein PilY1
MKHNHNKYFNLATYASGLVLMFTFALPFSAKAAPLDLVSIPLANSPTVPIQSNLLFIFDDSGSMAWDYMPDAHSSTIDSLFRNASYNTIYYNPAITYFPPAHFTSGGVNTTVYPSQTGAATANGASTAAKPNWKAVKRDAYGILSTATTKDDLTNDAYYYTTLPGEFCTKADLKDCAAQTAPSVARPFPAPVRWCNNSSNALLAAPAVNTCQATNMTGFTNLRIPGLVVAKITFSTSGSRTITNVKVGGQIITSAATTSTGGTNNASQTAANINACTAAVTGQCQVAGYSATVSSNVVTITAPAVTAIPARAVVTASNTTNVPTVTDFLKTTHPSLSGTNNAPGQTVYTVINNSAANYNYPSTSAKAGGRTDCGVSCTYEQEMTNYANWYTYYHTRAQMMKTSTSLAFKDIGDDFRVGFMATSTVAARSLNFARFNTAQKALWYAKLFNTPSDRNTPLRGALSKAGRIYANETTAKRGVFTDPIEYECQQNFALLTTDGFWNTADETSTYAGGPVNLSGANVGNLDASPTPLGMREGAAISNSLADVAKYYRDTDLRTPGPSPGLNNCTGALGNNVCSTPSSSPSPPNEKQTMVTLTMGLGVNGVLAYSANYDTVPGDYADIKAGTKNWPLPVENTITTVDDLWHAAVNGGGSYFSAKNPVEVVSQLQDAIASIKVKTGAGAAAATSTLNPVSGEDNFAYVASYTSGHWIGNLQKRAIIPTTGEVAKAALRCVEDVVPTDSCASPSSIVANSSGGYDCVTPGVTSASRCVLPSILEGTDCKKPVATSCTGNLKLKVSAFTSSTRNIKMNKAGALQDFSYANLTAAQAAYFDKTWLAANLTQWPSLTTDQQANVTGTNLVGYLRGETGYDLASTTENNRVFRKRQATLGDLIDSKPSFMGKPTFDYGDPGYQTFKAAQAGRAKTVYVGSNDGMLHAFDADTLEERWAYVPTMVIPNLWKLADSNYSAKHSNYVNGDIIISDICTANCTLPSATWKTILVAGLNGGGRGYYALDITNPTTPVLLWEFDARSTTLSTTLKGDANLGYSYGNPIVTKRNIDGRWVVLFTSGYNNIPDNSAFYNLSTTSFKPNNPAIYTTGNGGGYLYVVDAVSGDKLAAIPTLSSSSVNVGNTTTPSGLAKIKAYADEAEKNNVTTNVYGGDLLGNIWRFNIDTNQAFNFAQLQAGTAQPITTQPELALVNNKRVIIVGTGKYLEVADLISTSQQTLYAIKDDNASATLVNPRATLVKQTIVPDGADTRKSGPANAASPFQDNRGWYVDFPDARERQNVASRLVLGTLLVPTTVPESSACQPAGYGWFNYLDYRTGLAVVTNPASNVVSQRTTAPSVGFNVVYVNGKPKVSNVVADDENPKLIPDIPFTGSGTGFQLKRSIWREIID